MTEYAADYAAADLSLLEEGALHGLASIAYTTSIGDLHDFTEGWMRQTVTYANLRWALCALDALGWATPANEAVPPNEAMEWRITSQGRVALERRAP